MTAHVYGIGARGPLGMNAVQLAMCARAGKLCPSTTRFVDKRGQNIGMCVTGAIDDAVHGYDRLLALAAPALSEATAQAAARLREVGQRIDKAPLFLALPEAGRPDDDDRFARAVLGELATAARVPLDVAKSQVVRAGQAGGVLAIEAALGALGAGTPWAIVGGLDGYYHPDVLRWLDEECRLHALGAENGFIPSEGAAFFVLGARSFRDSSLASVTAAQGALETTVTRDEPNIAAAMTALVHQILPRATNRVGWVICDVNGERHRVREWAMVAMRTDLTQLPEQRLPDVLGDLGAASAATAVALAASYWQARCAPARSAIVAMHSEAAERAAALVEVPS
jgi:3-oxoacyl-[acyl-carrier-protein] synthase I